MKMKMSIIVSIYYDMTRIEQTLTETLIQGIYQGSIWPTQIVTDNTVPIKSRRQYHIASQECTTLINVIQPDI